MPTDKDIIIACFLDEHGHPELAWEPAKTCPQGHINYRRQMIDQICEACIQQMWDEREGHREQFASITEVANFMVRQPAIVTRQWRIQAVPKDFTQPAPLLSAAQAFQDSTKTIIMEPAFYRTKSDGLWDGELKLLRRFDEVEFRGDGESWGHAFRAALAAAILGV